MTADLPPVVEEVETVRFSYLPVGDRDRFAWSLSAHRLGDGGWRLAGLGCSFDEHKVWRHGYANLDHVYRFPDLDAVRAEVAVQLPDVVVNGMNTADLLEWRASRDHH